MGSWQGENKSDLFLILHPLLPQSIPSSLVEAECWCARKWKQALLDWYSTALPPILPKFLILCEGTFSLVHNCAADISLRDPFKPCQDSAIRFSDGWANFLGTFQSEDNLQIPLDTFPCCCLLLGTWFSGGLVRAGLMVELLKVLFQPNQFHDSI